eukprot:CAMPEP_0116147964 /NCGR_PEP_ID=MMETSP0329-20121206/18066_1 /TAXON_ID=697910 /ORGANISM="Pseudo-nitzschia arenysensis, Strain B593" /LENGTH=551 /DNA_ID=CAMNT_0003643989 /DNA_START=40 /DNA_END=1699 /DNA_ORIENTATION=+
MSSSTNHHHHPPPENDPFSFVQEPSIFQVLWNDLHEFCVKSFGLDPNVWMLRIVVSLVIVVAWEFYWNPPVVTFKQRTEAVAPTKQQQPNEETTRTISEPEKTEFEEQVSTKVTTAEDDVGESIIEEGTETIATNLKETKPQASEATSTTKTATNETESVNDDVTPDDTPSMVTTTLQTPKESSKELVSKTTTATANANTTTSTSISTAIPSFVWEEPGLGPFQRWYETETSLYRIYTLGRKDGTAVPPYIPSSQRGRTAVELHVTNNSANEIHVFWVDYKGNHVPKGRIPKHSGVWTQTTWIDHPWVFQDAITKTPYLYFVPYQVIPTIPQAPTVGSNGRIGLYKFSLVDAMDDDTCHFLGVSDAILPLPETLDQPLKAIHWTLAHLDRWNAIGNNNNVAAAFDTNLLQKYLVNILNHPEIFKYRNLKIASQRFGPLWNSPIRGLLLAVGFVEYQGYAKLGNSTTTLESHKIQDVALLSYLLTRQMLANQIDQQQDQQQEQPSGAADGFGRAGFGRAGAWDDEDDDDDDDDESIKKQNGNIGVYCIALHR